MELKDFLNKYQIKQVRFCAECGISLSTLRNCLLKKVRISLEVAETIERYTEGLVTVAELRPPIKADLSRMKTAYPSWKAH